MAGEDDEGLDIEETAPTIDGIEEAGGPEPAPEPGEAAAAADSGHEPSEPIPEPSEPVGARSRVRLVAFASGRGGTGRSLLAANVAVYLAQAAKKEIGRASCRERR